MFTIRNGPRERRVKKEKERKNREKMRKKRKSQKEEKEDDDDHAASTKSNCICSCRSVFNFILVDCAIYTPIYISRRYNIFPPLYEKPSSRSCAMQKVLHAYSQEVQYSKLQHMLLYNSVIGVTGMLPMCTICYVYMYGI